MSPFSFLSLLIWTHSLCPLVILPKGLSISLIFQRTTFWFFWFFLWSSLILLGWFQFWVWLFLAFYSSWVYYLPFCCRTFKCAVKLLIYALSCFFLQALRAMCFPISTAFIVSHKFGYVVTSNYENNRKQPSLFLNNSKYQGTLFPTKKTQINKLDIEWGPSILHYREHCSEKKTDITSEWKAGKQLSKQMVWRSKLE